ncbi:ApeI family dehydratase [Methylohalobius crimeensis]|uniref:ApeI family dehydratase n=1 Tax=Methylohalobius crimeensis TaxID=244365 RepID=UPI0003B46C77|nr:hydroxymyristoyl-ACP dehydratase [Methylohalobius crimeensis]
MPEPVVWPQIRGRERDGNSIVLGLRLPRELAYFEGHFEDCPILPGVVQIHWAGLLFLREFDADLVLQRMEVVKFKRLLVPEMEVTLQLDYDPERLRLAFHYRAGSVENSSGRLYWSKK